MALVTGVSRGLGQGMAVGLAEAGAEIIVVGGQRQVRNKREEVLTNYA